MSRHRNVRSMNYSEEYEGFDDVYGHSVEDDYSISPSDAQFMYDRSRQHQMSAFFKQQGDIAEEDEPPQTETKVRRQSFQRPVLNDTDEAKLRSCLEEIHNVVGDSVPESQVIEAIMKHDFDYNQSLDYILNSSQSAESEVPKPQRQRTDRNRASRNQKESKAVENDKVVTSNAANNSGDTTVPAPAPVVKVIPSTVNATKGFQVVSTKSNADPHHLKLETGSTPRSESPSSGRGSPLLNAKADEVIEKKKDVMKTPRMRDSKIDISSQYIKDRGQGKEQLHMVVIGHVDAGKSTLMGHLLFSLGQVQKKTMHKYEQESKKIGKQSFLYAWILDETGEERSRGITMDVGQSKFETNNKIVTLLDAPGHKDFIPNMITGATQADVALLVVDATRGEFETGFESGGQTREHAVLVRSLGITQIGVVVNKLDTVNWSQERFDEVVSKLGSFLRQVGFRESDVAYIPCSGLTGENLVSPPVEDLLLKWYKGPCLIEVIDKWKSPERSVTKPFRLSISDIFKGTGSGFCVSGRVETGMVQPGDKVLVMPRNEIAQVKALNIDDCNVNAAYSGDQVCATISGIEMQNVFIGHILCDPAQPIPVTSHFEARIVIFTVKTPITKGYPVILHHQSMLESAVITKLVAQLNKSTGEVVKKRPRCLPRSSSAVVEIQTSRHISLELYKNIKELGRFMLRVEGMTVAAGLVTEIF